MQDLHQHSSHRDHRYDAPHKKHEGDHTLLHKTHGQIHAKTYEKYHNEIHITVHHAKTTMATTERPDPGAAARHTEWFYKATMPTNASRKSHAAAH